MLMQLETVIEAMKKPRSLNFKGSTEKA